MFVFQYMCYIATSFSPSYPSQLSLKLQSLTMANLAQPYSVLEAPHCSN